MTQSGHPQKNDRSVCYLDINFVGRRTARLNHWAINANTQGFLTLAYVLVSRYQESFLHFVAGPRRIMKSSKTAGAGLGIGICLSIVVTASVNAMLPVSPLKSDPTVVLVRDKCGIGWYRGSDGACRRISSTPANGNQYRHWSRPHCSRGPTALCTALGGEALNG